MKIKTTLKLDRWKKRTN